MNQSSFIAGALLAGFVLYLAAKGRLANYAAVLWGPTNTNPVGDLTLPGAATVATGAAAAGAGGAAAGALEGGIGSGLGGLIEDGGLALLEAL